MIISRTPYRLSFCGGSTDFPAWYANHGGICVGTTINKYSHIAIRDLPAFHDYKSRFVYSELEHCSNSEVQHRAINAVLKYAEIDDSQGVEILHFSDLPGKSGIGSSSSFVVGLLNAIYAFQGKHVSKSSLSQEAVYIEQTLMSESVGCQDQTLSAHGGLNILRIDRQGDVAVSPLPISAEHKQEFESHVMLFFTGISRISSHVVSSYVNKLANRQKEQWALMQLAEDSIGKIINRDWEGLGRIIDQNWRLKRDLSTDVSNCSIDRMYASAQIHGAWGGKITGAGGGGSLLLIAPPEKHPQIAKALEQEGCLHIPVSFDSFGSQIIFAS